MPFATFQFQAILGGAGGNDHVGRRNGQSLFAAATGQRTGLGPDLFINGDKPEFGFQIFQYSFFGFASSAVPKFNER